MLSVHHQYFHTHPYFSTFPYQNLSVTVRLHAFPHVSSPELTLETAAINLVFPRRMSYTDASAQLPPLTPMFIQRQARVDFIDARTCPSSRLNTRAHPCNRTEADALALALAYVRGNLRARVWSSAMYMYICICVGSIVLARARSFTRVCIYIHASTRV